MASYVACQLSEACQVRQMHECMWSQVGPYLGGLLSAVSLQLCAWVAAGMTVSLIAVVPFISAGHL